jgi:hypothetical protein
MQKHFHVHNIPFKVERSGNWSKMVGCSFLCKQNYFERAHHSIVVQNKMLREGKMVVGAK